MSNLEIKLRQQVNAQSGPRAHPKHLAALAEAKKLPRVRVAPVNEEHRHILRHPNGPPFRAEGSAEWPLDRFTHRRLRDGSIKIVERVEHGRRQQEKPAQGQGKNERQGTEKPQRPEQRQEKPQEKADSSA